MPLQSVSVHEADYDLCALAAVRVFERLERAVAPLDDAGAYRPTHGGVCPVVDIEGVLIGQDVGVLAHGNVELKVLCEPVQHRDERFARQRIVRREAGSDAVGDPRVHRPADGIRKPGAFRHIVKGSEAPEVPKFNAHRGLQPFGPENSIASLEAAAERRVWAIETDFRMTADSEVVCIHDGTLDRTTDGKGRVKDHTLQEIRSFRVKEVNTKPVRKRYDYAALTDRQRMIPTMDEYFDICRKGDCVAFVELKEDDGVIVRMNEAIERHGMTGRCVISSGKKPLLKAYRDSGGKELIHLIFGKTEDLDFLLELGNAAVAFNYPDLGTEIHLEHHGQKIDSLKELVDYCHSLGLKICFRAVDTQEDLERSLALGIDYLPTNNLW